MVVRPAMMCGLHTVSLTKRPEAELEMLRFSLGMSRMDRIRNESIRGSGQAVWRQSQGRKAEMVWACTEEGWWI